METIADVTDVLTNAPSEPVVGKKKPGRPKKMTVSVSANVKGIVDTPTTPGAVLELIYHSPTLFKKIMQLLKAFEVEEVEFNFDKLGLKIAAVDHLGNSNICVIIRGEHMNLYYCKEPLRICVSRANLDKTLGILAKVHYNICFMLKENYRSMMSIGIRDMDYDNDELFEIDIIYKPDSFIDSSTNDDSNYPIKFRMSSKHFKTKINNMKKISDEFSIEKSGDDPLQFSTNRPKTVAYIGVYNDSDKISLRSTIASDDIFKVSMTIDHIKPFSNSGIGDFVEIAVDKRKMISFTTDLDKKDDLGRVYAAQIKIYTKIINCQSQ